MLVGLDSFARILLFKACRADQFRQVLTSQGPTVKPVGIQFFC